MKTVSKGSIVTLTIAVIMAAVMLLFSPLQALAAGGQVLGRYISELIIVTDGQVNDAEAAGYTVSEKPIYENTADKENGAGATYIAFKTTNNAAEAITDIRVMNMNGGWSFAEYENYQKELRANAEKLAAELWNAVLEFRTLYNNPDTCTENVQYAYDLLNVLYDDDILDEQGKPMGLGDIFANANIIKDGKDDKYITIFMESNMDALQVIYTALGNACSKAYGGTFLEKINEDPFSYTDQYSDTSALDSYVAKLKDSISQARNYMDYFSSVKESNGLESEADIKAHIETLAQKDAQSGTSDSLAMAKGYVLTKELSNTEYYGIEGEFDTLYDFISSYDTFDDEEYIMANLRAIIGAMSSGMRSLMMLGLASVVNICATEDGHYYDMLNKMKDDAEYSDIIKNGISIFSGIDREIFEDHAVAMTSAALRENAEGNTSWQNTNKDKAATLHKYAVDMAISGGVLGFFGLSTTLFVIGGIAAGNGAEVLKELGQWLIFSATGSQALGASILAWCAVLSIVSLIVMIVLFALSASVPEPDNEIYEEIPGMLCDYRVTVDSETGAEDKDTEEYIYYKGVKNPFGVRTESLYPDVDDNSKLPENKKGVMDIYNWELKGSRQWLALYTTKDRRAGFPVMADKTFAILDQKEKDESKTGGKFASFFGSDNSQGCDLAMFYQLCADDEATALYLRYTVDPKAVYPDDKEQDVMRTLIGSAVSNGASWGMGVIGLGLGCLGGILIGKHSKKKLTV